MGGTTVPAILHRDTRFAYLGNYQAFTGVRRQATSLLTNRNTSLEVVPKQI